MAGNEGRDSTPVSDVDDDVDCLVINGVEYFAKRYRGCSKCSSKGKSRFYEASIKKSLEGKKRVRPIHSDTLPNKSSVTTPSIPDHLQLMIKKLKVSVDRDSPAKNSDEVIIPKPNISELEEVVEKLQNYLSSLKYKLQKYKDQESQQSRRGRQEILEEAEENEDRRGRQEILEEAAEENEDRHDAVVEATEEAEKELEFEINEEPSGGEMNVVMASDDE